MVDKDLKMKVAERISAEMERQGISYGELANETKVPKASL